MRVLPAALVVLTVSTNTSVDLVYGHGSPKVAHESHASPKTFLHSLPNKKQPVNIDPEGVEEEMVPTPDQVLGGVSLPEATSVTRQLLEDCMTKFDPTSKLMSYVDEGSCGPRGGNATVDTSDCPNGAKAVCHHNGQLGFGGCTYYEYTEYECIISTPGPTMSSASSKPTDSPSKSPTPAPTITIIPTSSPTMMPSKSPTNNPSKSPSSAPTIKADWTISFQDFIANFTALSNKELEIKYELSRGRDHETFLYQKDCKTNITDINITLSTTRMPINTTFDSFTLKYDIPKGDIASSSEIWNSTTNQVEVCQVVNLIIPSTKGRDKMVISSDVRATDVNFDLTANFEVTSSLKAATTKNATTSTDVSSYIIPCLCSSSSFECIFDALAPNDVLYVCIVSTSTDVEVHEVVTMDIAQEEKQLEVIVGSTTKLPSITSTYYDPSKNGVRVATRVPQNIFSFATGNNITVSGVIETKLVGSEQKTRALVGADNIPVDGTDKGAYELQVTLVEETEFGSDGAVPMISFGHVLGMGIVISSIVISFVITSLW